MSQTILPSNNSPLMHALARLAEAETAAIDWRVITHSKDPAVCAAAWLPWLAWENSISDAEGWRFAEAALPSKSKPTTGKPLLCACRMLAGGVVSCAVPSAAAWKTYCAKTSTLSTAAIGSMYLRHRCSAAASRNTATA